MISNIYNELNEYKKLFLKEYNKFIVEYEKEGYVLNFKFWSKKRKYEKIYVLAEIYKTKDTKKENIIILLNKIFVISNNKIIKKKTEPLDKALILFLKKAKSGVDICKNNFSLSVKKLYLFFENNFIFKKYYKDNITPIIFIIFVIFIIFMAFLRAEAIAEWKYNLFGI